LKKETTKTKSVLAVRTMLVVSGLVSLVLGYLLWMNILSLEQVVAIVLVAAGVFKLVIGLFK